MKPSNLHRRNRWTIDAGGIVACILLSIALYYAGLQPLAAGYDRYLSQQAELELKQQTATTSNASLQTLQRRLGALQQQITDHPLHLQPASAVNKRLGELTELAAHLGLRMEDVQPGKTSATARFETVTIHLAGSGTYRTCVQFLHRLRTGFPDTSITSFQLTGNPSDSSGSASFQFDLKWFTAVPEAEPKK
jgi:Tfp pilus assembly protein PilO